MKPINCQNKYQQDNAITHRFICLLDVVRLEDLIFSSLFLFILNNIIVSTNNVEQIKYTEDIWMFKFIAADLKNVYFKIKSRFFSFHVYISLQIQIDDNHRI